MTLGHYLWPSPDVGSHMIHNILKMNGQTFHQTTLHSPTMIEIASEIHQLERQRFDESMAIEPRTKPTADDFLPEELTPEQEKDTDNETSSELHDAVDPTNE